MVKKVVKKTTNPKQKSIDKALVDNFVALQKVLTNLSVKFDNLSDRISKLLDVFEISAKALAEKDFERFKDSNTDDILEKLEEIQDQNKTIARGLTLLYEPQVDDTSSLRMERDFPGGTHTNEVEKKDHTQDILDRYKHFA